MDRIKRLRWQQRSLPDDIKINLSPQEVQVPHPVACAFGFMFPCIHIPWLHIPCIHIPCMPTILCTSQPLVRSSTRPTSCATSST